MFSNLRDSTGNKVDMRLVWELVYYCNKLIYICNNQNKK